MVVSFIGGVPRENHRPATGHWQIVQVLWLYVDIHVYNKCV
jgi:hypothetical protein